MVYFSLKVIAISECLGEMTTLLTKILAGLLLITSGAQALSKSLILN